ncbi:MAG TPA: hypothetical protein VHA56_19395 [Mucilaginibacter sp.]|nr:hypothetical protein [Mucilaginibacter sp.]
MKTAFTKLFSIAVLLSLTAIGFKAKAQTNSLVDAGTPAAKVTAPVTYTQDAPKAEAKTAAETKNEVAAPTKAAEDTSWKPVRRLWGYSFGDFYYNAHQDAGNRGGETNYKGVPTYRNAFQLRRVYLGYDYDINKKFSVSLLLASEPSASTGVNGSTSIQNGDNLVDNKMAFFIKNINLRWKNVWNGTDFIIGEQSTPGFATMTEGIWGYRSIEKTVADFHKESGSYDLGAGLQGVFDPKTKNFGYDILIGNNSGASLLSAANANTGFYKMFYGDIFAKFLDKKLILDLYFDNLKTAGSTATLGPQSRTTIKGFAAYTTPKVTFGVEAYTSKITNGLTNSTTNNNEDATVNAISVYVRGAIVKDQLGFFARFDSYNPDTDLIGTDSYKVNTNLGSYDPYTKESFYTAGLDFTPAKNIHFMPNLWLIDYKDQRNASTSGYIAPDHNLVYRLTFYYVFGK